MITEDYVTFEIAKLLKEKGFDGVYTSKIGISGIRYKVSEVGNPFDKIVPCPTHQMAMKWLREKHGIHIGVFIEHFDNLMDVTSNQYFAEMFNLRDDLEVLGSTDRFDTYEQAVESAILFILRNLL